MGFIHHYRPEDTMGNGAEVGLVAVFCPLCGGPLGSAPYENSIISYGSSYSEATQRWEPHLAGQQRVHAAAECSCVGSPIVTIDVTRRIPLFPNTGKPDANESAFDMPGEWHPVSKLWGRVPDGDDAEDTVSRPGSGDLTSERLNGGDLPPVVTAPTLDEVRGWPAAVDIRRACEAIGISASWGYELVKAGEFPCKVLTIRGRSRVLTASLVALLEGKESD